MDRRVVGPGEGLAFEGRPRLVRLEDVDCVGGGHEESAFAGGEVSRGDVGAPGRAVGRQPLVPERAAEFRARGRLQVEQAARKRQLKDVARHKRTTDHPGGQLTLPLDRAIRPDATGRAPCQEDFSIERTRQVAITSPLAAPEDGAGLEVDRVEEIRVERGDEGDAGGDGRGRGAPTPGRIQAQPAESASRLVVVC